MLFRLYALYRRYVGHHADRLCGRAIRYHGRRIGRLERVWRIDGALRIVGWTSAQHLRLSWPGGCVTTVPGIERADVQHRLGLPLETGFEIEVSQDAKPLTLHAILPSGGEISCHVPHPSEPPTALARSRLALAFVRDALRAAPVYLRSVVTRDPAARARIKEILGLVAVSRGLPIDASLFSDQPAPRSDHPITIILPVHNAFELLEEALRRVAAHTDVDWHLILIDDASSDPRVRPFLRAWSDTMGDRVSLVELDRNLGFVGAVNRGFELAEGHAGHVVLLNSDAMVPEGWASRLIAPFDRDKTIASVTPMSNNAEIFSAPMICRSMQIPAGMVDRIDAVAQRLSWPDPLPQAPTGVGFCMAMSARWFARFPRFDTAFGRGYGEEVDWCQKTRAAGAVHVGLPTVFVEHRGGESFGLAQKQDRVLRANAMIARRYPSYDAEVQSYIATDPLRTPRIALAVAMAGELATDAVPLFVAHSLGGGADHALMAEIATYTGRGQYGLILRVGGPHRWQLEVHGPNGTMSVGTGQLDDIKRLVAPLPALRMVYSCGVGDPDPVGLPAVMLALIRPDHPDRLEARLHDFFVVSPSYCLLDADGAFRGSILRANPDPAHGLRRADGSVVLLDRWQDAWHGFLSRCAEITVFSQTSAAHLLASYPDLRDAIVLRPHQINASIGRVAPPAPGAGTLAILGNINHQKGAGVLCALAARMARAGGPRLVLIGNIDPAFSLPPLVRLHGSYHAGDIAELAQRYGVGAWLMPSIWPETFSFATHEMLATGLPVYGFDIGAQGEALAHAPNGIPIPFDPDGDHAAAVLAMLRRRGPWQNGLEAASLQGLEAAE